MPMPEQQICREYANDRRDKDNQLFGAGVKDVDKLARRREAKAR